MSFNSSSATTNALFLAQLQQRYQSLVKDNEANQQSQQAQNFQNALNLSSGAQSNEQTPNSSSLGALLTNQKQQPTAASIMDNTNPANGLGSLHGGTNNPGAFLLGANNNATAAEAKAATAPNGDGPPESLDAQGDLDRNGQHHPIAEFLYQLTKMLTDDNSEIIEWADGRIKVHYPERLEAEVLHKYFRHSKFASFQRQLNYFGFRKIAGKGKMSPCSYVNDAATSDIRSLLLIKRKTNGSAARKAAMQQRAAALANSTLNPLLQFPGAAAALANNPAALASLANPQALSGAMALLSDNAVRAGLLAQAQQQQAGLANPQLSLLALQQQQHQQQQQQQQQPQLDAASQALFNSFKAEQGNAASAALNSLNANPLAGGGQQQQQPQQQQQQQQPALDNSQIAQQHQQQLQQLQQQLQQLQQQQRSQQKAAETAPPSSDLSSSVNALNESSKSATLAAANEAPAPSAPAPATSLEQLQAQLAARINQSAAPASNAAASLSGWGGGAASAALKLQQQQAPAPSAGDNPASAALQQLSLPATAAMDADSSSAQASNNLFESALNLKSLLQEHQAGAPGASSGGAEAPGSAAAAARAGLVNRLPSSNTLFPSVASFGNLLGSSNRLSSLLSLSSFVGGAPGAAPGGAAPAPGGTGSREPSLADLAAAVNSVGSGMPLNAAALMALQQHSNSAQNFRTDNI